MSFNEKVEKKIPFTKLLFLQKSLYGVSDIFISSTVHKLIFIKF